MNKAVHINVGTRFVVKVETREDCIRVSCSEGVLSVQPIVSNVVEVRPELTWDDTTKMKIVAEMIMKQDKPKMHRLQLASNILAVLKGNPPK